ncbi:MAG TPA: hypothetical protein DCP28_00290, partial [Cytophagales bacterium]|nr:hypothetical protein [Cytophagales bacterium]
GQQTMQRNTSVRWPTLAPLQKATKNRPFAPIQRVINPLNPGEYKRGTFFSSAMQKAMALVPLYNALPENDYQSRHIRLGQISAHVNDWITRYTADNPSEQVQTYLDNADQFLVQVQQERASIQRPYDAIVAVRASNMPMQEQNRAVALIRQPDMTQQGYFGTCGLVGIMRGTLLADPRKFVQWAITTMGDAGTLVQSRQRWDTNRNLLGQHEISDENDAAKLDFYMAQWMIKDKLETPAQQGGQGSPEAHLLNQQQRFSPLIAAEANINDWENEGHYALTGEGLAQIAERLLNQGQAGYVPIGNGTFLAAWQQASQGGRAVIASTIGAFHQATQSLTKQDGTNEDTTAGFLENHGEADITNVEITGPRQAHPQEPRTNNNALDSADPAQRTIAFDHWVMIDSVAQAGGGRLRLVIWSWGNKKTYLIRTADINTYFHSLVWVAP